MELEPPVAYQGGKTRIATDIAAHIEKEFKPGGVVYDLCCGCGAVSLALLNRGLDPSRLILADSGLWGAFWSAIAQNTFDLGRFRSIVQEIPEDPRKIQEHVRALAGRDASIDTIYVFLVLQAASFGSKPISVDGSKWKTHGFRSFWEPTATSNRRSHVNPMMPMPATLLSRVEMLCAPPKGYTALRQDVQTLDAGRPGCVVYVDPPYAGLTSYADSFDAVKLAKQFAAQGATVLVSEAKALGPEAHCIAAGRKKGGVSGNRVEANEEWLTIFRPEVTSGAANA